MATHAEQRATIVDSVFAKLDEDYVSHVKIWEDAGAEGRKPRYIILSQSTSNNGGFLHKSRLNTNGTYSVGKTWQLSELRSIQLLSATAFNITLSRTYRWDTDNGQDQSNFIDALADVFQTINRGVPLRVEGLQSRAPPASRQPVQNGYMRPGRTPSPPPAAPSVNGRRRAQTPTRQYDVEPNEIPRSQSRTAISRPSSPTTSSRGGYARDPPRPSSSASNATSSSARAPRAASARRPGVINNGSPLPSFSSQSSIPPELPPPSSRGSPELPRARPSRSRPSSPTESAPSFRKPPASRQGRESPSVNRTGRESPGLSRRELREQREQAEQREQRESPTATRSLREVPTAAGRDPPAPRPPRPTTPEARPKRDPNARISFFDHANQAALDRLLSQGATEGEGEEESTQATMASVEEMIEGYEWVSDDIIGRRTVRGAAELIEARLLDELTALDKANIHSFLETDDRVAIVMRFMDDALLELDNMDSLVSSYKIHLNNVGDDISFIQSQNRGLQVQTQNQRALLTELENLLKTVQVSKSALVSLTQESLEKSDGIERLEKAAAELYKALQAGRNTEMAASMERLQEYKTHNVQFCKRILDFLTIMFTAQGQLLLGDSDGVLKDRRGQPTAVAHNSLEEYLGRYAGLMLFLKEMDEPVYAKLCATYFSASSELASTQLKSLFSSYLALVRKEDSEQSFNPYSVSGTKAATGIRRAGTLIRSPMESSRKDKDRDTGDTKASEVFTLLLEQLAPLVYREDEFLTDFLQINDAALTFADYMNLDNYFRRQASRSAGLSQGTMKLVRGAMELIFGFLPTEIKAWLDGALAKDDMQLFGLLVCLERFLTDADEKGNQFLQSTLEKQHTRLKTLLDRHISEQIRQIEANRQASKKRRGVAHFIKHFPVYISRVEPQMGGADGLEIRGLVDAGYERIVESIFDCLKQIAKMDSGEGEEKGQLNYHIVLIENMHQFNAEMTQLQLGAVRTYVQKAESIYDENVAAYVKMTLRRPFGKIIEYFEGVERLLKTTDPKQVSTNASYNKSALKKVTKDYNGKDIRKHVENLAKRIEKHFTEGSDGPSTAAVSSGIASGTAMAGVWKAFEEELLRITELFTKRVGQCYPDSGVTLEYTRADVESAFRKHRVG